MFGIFSAGIAFTLKDNIVNVAARISLKFGRLSDLVCRIPSVAVRSEVIAIGVPRTTLMACGEWINGDQYYGQHIGLYPTVVQPTKKLYIA